MQFAILSDSTHAIQTHYCKDCILHIPQTHYSKVRLVSKNTMQSIHSLQTQYCIECIALHCIALHCIALHCIVFKHNIAKNALCPNTLLHRIHSVQILHRMPSVQTQYCKECIVSNHTIASNLSSTYGGQGWLL